MMSQRCNRGDFPRRCPGKPPRQQDRRRRGLRPHELIALRKEEIKKGGRCVEQRGGSPYAASPLGSVGGRRLAELYLKTCGG